jgi:NitT/TauT family transport system substrate-binding protein
MMRKEGIVDMKNLKQWSSFRAFSLLLAGFLLASALPLFGSGAKEKKESLVIRGAVYKGSSGFGAVRLLEDPPELGAGISVEFQVLPTPQEMVARVSSGEVDIAVFPTNLAAKLYNAGTGYRLGGVIGYGILHLLSSDTGIASWADLDGKTVYTVGKGATPDFLLRYFLSRSGVEKQVSIDYSITAAPQLAQALIGGKVEYGVLPEPFATLVSNKAPTVSSVIDFQQSWNDLYGGEEGRSYPITVVVLSSKLLDSHPEVARRFLDAYKASIEWVRANPDDAAALIEKFDIMPAAIAAPAIPNCNLVFLPAVESRPLVEDFLRVLLDFDPASIGGKLPDEGFYFQ